MVNSATKDEQDGDIDIKVKIAPNNYEEEFNVETESHTGPQKGQAYFLRDFIQYEGQYIRHFKVVAHRGKDKKKGTRSIIVELTGYGTEVKVKVRPTYNNIEVKAPKDGSAPPNMIILPVNKGVYSVNDFKSIKTKYEDTSYGANVTLDGGNITGGDFVTADCFGIALDVISGKLIANIPSIDPNYLYPGQSGEDRGKDNENARAFNSLIGLGIQN